MAGFFIYSDKADIAASLIGFAKTAGKAACAITFNQEAAEEIKNCGADKIYVLKGDSVLPESYGKAVAEFLKNEGAELFAVGATARGRDLAARVAGYLDCSMVSNVASVQCADGKVITERSMFGGAVVLTEVLTGLSVITIGAGMFEATTGTGEIVTVAVQADNRISHIETACLIKSGADLSAAEKVISVGMGLDKEEDLTMVRELAQLIGAEIGCSRGIAEERHWLPVANYIGISGAVIKPALYLGMGVSGQIQHVFGMRDSKVVAAIDKNEKAPIFKAADYGIVGDMYEILPLLISELKKA